MEDNSAAVGAPAEVNSPNPAPGAAVMISPPTSGAIADPTEEAVEAVFPVIILETSASDKDPVEEKGEVFTGASNPGPVMVGVVVAGFGVKKSFNPLAASPIGVVPVFESFII